MTTLIELAGVIGLKGSESANAFRKKVSRYASTKCGGCEEKCVGGCPLLWIKFNPDEEIRGKKSE
ncbi:MAG TPA: hypothetical protein VMC07_01345 [Candidatus Omnitrophota bacterium]|nr:hypothetical protein [Candidatus Omnitrophota bacterium]